MIWCPSVISKTRMAEVKGDRVTPVKKATIPAKISKLVLEADRLSNPEIADPMLAPESKAGAKTPPAAPLVKLTIDPSILIIGVYQCTNLSVEKRILDINSFPEFRYS